jgi:endonuclease-3
VLYVTLEKRATLRFGALGEHELDRGKYLYVGSARRGIAARVARHEKLAGTKTGRTHWHIDYLLIHPQCRLTRIEVVPGAEECSVSQRIAQQKGATTPILGFGASDCRSGCPAHLYRMGKTTTFTHSRLSTRRALINLCAIRIRHGSRVSRFSRIASSMGSIDAGLTLAV